MNAGGRISVSSFVSDQRAAAAAHEAAQWRESVSTAHRARASYAAPAVRLLVAQLTSRLTGSEGVGVDWCRCVGDWTYRGPVRWVPAVGLLCDDCASAAVVDAGRTWVCDCCLTRAPGVDAGLVPVLVEHGGVLLQLQLCRPCWRGNDLEQVP